jgi:HAD superfamily hydrolase (TIGR01509 family)
MRRTRLAVTVFFFADGLLVGSWAGRVPAVQRHADLTNGELGLALFAIALGALVSMPLAGSLSERLGSRRVTIAALVAGSVSLFLASLATGLVPLAAALLVFGAGFGGMNVAVNAQGIALERRYGRSILSSFHAAFSVGGLVGAGLGAVAAGAGVGVQAHFGAVALAILGVAVVEGHRLLAPEGRPASHTPVLALPPRSLLVLGAAAFVTLLAEGAAADWSAVYLTDSVGATAAVAALGYAGFALAMAASRAVGDHLNERFGPVALARGGGLLAAAGLTLALTVGSTVAGLAGFVVMGAGIGVIVPVLFRAAGSTPGLSADRGVAAVSTVGWLGFLAGPPAIGLVAELVGLRTALGLVVLATVALAFLAYSAEPRRRLVLEPKAVISDLDGVLVDSTAYVERAWTAFAERHGLEPAGVLAISHGRRTVDVIRLAAPHLDAEAEAAAIEAEAIGAAELIEPLPGARELVASIPPEHFAIVTSGTRGIAVARLRAAGIRVPDVLVTAEEVDRGKPDPAGYLRAAALLGVEPSDAVVLEDAAPGVEAGRAAGMTVVAVLTTTDEASLCEAHAIVPDLRALLPGPEQNGRRSDLAFRVPVAQPC